MRGLQGAAGPSTRAVHAGEETRAPKRASDPSGPEPGRPVSLPIHQTAPFTFDDVDSLDRAFADPGREGVREGLYSRYGNPSVRQVEEKVAALEGAPAAVAFASGMGAISAALSSLLASGDSLLAAAELYGGTHAFLEWLTHRQPEVRIERVPMADLPERLEEGSGEAPRAVYLETPSNPLMACCDLERVGRACRRRGAILVVDNTFATPVLQRPLELGAHLVVHSATKFLAGHSDVTAGVVAGEADLVDRVRETLRLGGACLDPHAAFLVARGIQTLSLRVERQSANARRLAELLREHPAVSRVLYPGFDPVGRVQMSAGGGMLAFELEATGDLPAAEAARRVVDRLQLMRIIPSLGGVETGVMLPALTSHRSLSAAERRQAGIGDGLVRVSCGIEDGEDLEADLLQGLEQA